MSQALSFRLPSIELEALLRQPDKGDSVDDTPGLTTSHATPPACMAQLANRERATVGVGWRGGRPLTTLHAPVQCLREESTRLSAPPSARATWLAPPLGGWPTTMRPGAAEQRKKLW